ncbi:MAG TPA: Ku protein [Polyangiaceae bacterium]|nr:Ku protein [Polyangiaceae bacterium]
MPTRAMWKGVLRVGKLSVPTTLHAAVEDVAVHFHLLHDEDGIRVRQRLVNPVTGETRSGGEVHKGFEIAPGSFVLLTEDELRSLEPEPSREIRFHGFVPRSAIGPAWYDRPYYLLPDGQEESYAALKTALEKRGEVGVAHWVMRKIRYHGAVLPHGEHLVIVTLRTIDEVVKPPKVEPTQRAAEARELSMAEQLVQALSGDFLPEDYEDEHRDRVRALVEAKARGRTPKKAIAPRRAPERSLSAALEASIARVNKERKSA